MKRRVVLPLVVSAALAAAALPIVALAAPEGAKLPDLRADPPENPELQVYGDGRLLLRFDGFVTNVGQGPLDIDGNPSGNAMFQDFRLTDGGWASQEGEETRPVEVKFETADGHNHFHLMKIMRYSLWNGDRSAEVAPGQKVGFCLYDIEQAPPDENGDPPPVVAPGFYDGGGDFCRQGNRFSTALNMGVSAGWRDVYGRELALQWVDVSDTPPGEYYPASEADPESRVDEASRSNNGPTYGAKITIPGYVATAPAEVETPGGQPVQITLGATKYGSPGARRFRVVTPPAHGSLDVTTGSNFTQDTVTYTPAAGYGGPDSLRFAAINGGGQFAPYPKTPVTATASIQVGEQPAAPAVTISGAPASLTAGTSAQLSATVSDAGPAVTWSASAGTIDADGLFTAPAAVPPGGSVTIRATSVDAPDAFAEATILIVAPPPPAPAPITPGTPRGIDPTTGGGGGPVQPAPKPTNPRPVLPIRGLLTSPVLTRSANGRILVVRTTPRAAGKVTINIVYGRSTVARCTTKARLGRRIVCKLTLPRRVASKSVRVVVALRGSGRANATVKTVAKAPRKVVAAPAKAKATAAARANPRKP